MSPWMLVHVVVGMGESMGYEAPSEWCVHVICKLRQNSGARCLELEPVSVRDVPESKRKASARDCPCGISGDTDNVFSLKQ